MTKKKIVAVITAITGDRVIISQDTLLHVIDDHFRVFPQDIILELIERILKDPSELYQDKRNQNREFNFFYRLESGKFIVVVVKIISEGAFLASMYPTGKKLRNAHKRLKRVKL